MIFKKKSFCLALAPVFFLLLFSLIGSFFTPHDPFEQQLQQALLPPSSELSAVPTATAAAFSHVF